MNKINIKLFLFPHKIMMNKYIPDMVIEITPFVKIIDTMEFQRLRDLKQLERHSLYFQVVRTRLDIQ